MHRHRYIRCFQRDIEKLPLLDLAKHTTRDFPRVTAFLFLFFRSTTSLRELHNFAKQRAYWRVGNIARLAAHRRVLNKPISAVGTPRERQLEIRCTS